MKAKQLGDQLEEPLYAQEHQPDPIELLQRSVAEKLGRPLKDIRG
jgi:hypothetical protein